MPITRVSPDPGAAAEGATDENEVNLDVFHIQEAFEVYDGVLALAIDHLLNHLKVLITLAYLPGSDDLQQALKRHPVLRRKLRQDSGRRNKDNEEAGLPEIDGRSVDRVVLAECQRLLDGVMEIAHLTAWPETAGQAQVELELLRREVPFLDYRYDNDPFPSDRDHEERE
jgi:hypothetical protein